MNGKQIKELRGQVRQVVQDLLPSILIGEQYEELRKLIDARLTHIEKMVKDSLHEINERHKDTMGYLVRTVTTPQNTDKK